MNGYAAGTPPVEVLRLWAACDERRGLVHITTDGVIASWNVGAARISGRSAADAIGTPWTDLSAIPQEGVERAQSLRRHDGSTVLVRLTMTAFDERGEHRGFALVMRDDSAAGGWPTSEVEDRYRASIDHLADALFTHRDGVVVDVNRAACESLGYTRQELIGMVPTDFDPDATQTQVQELLTKLRRDGTAAFESRHRRKDGSAFPVEVRIRNVVSDGITYGLSLVRAALHPHHHQPRLQAVGHRVPRRRLRRRPRRPLRPALPPRRDPRRVLARQAPLRLRRPAAAAGRSPAPQAGAGVTGSNEINAEHDRRLQSVRTALGDRASRQVAELVGAGAVCVRAQPGGLVGRHENTDRETSPKTARPAADQPGAGGRTGTGPRRGRGRHPSTAWSAHGRGAPARGPRGAGRQGHRDQIARRLGVHASTVEGWRQEALVGVEQALRRGSGKSAAELELERKHRDLEKVVTTLSIQKCLLEQALEIERKERPTGPARSRR